MSEIASKRRIIAREPCSTYVANRRLKEQFKKAPSPEVFGMLVMGAVSLPRIEVPKFGGATLSWRSFWEKFQASVHNKPHFGNVDRLTYLRDALKGRSATYVNNSMWAQTSILVSSP